MKHGAELRLANSCEKENTIDQIRFIRNPSLNWKLTKSDAVSFEQVLTIAQNFQKKFQLINANGCKNFQANIEIE